MHERFLTGFRENRDLEDPEEIQLQIDVALNGLGQIRQFTRLDKSSPNWNFHTLSNPVRFLRSLSLVQDFDIILHTFPGHCISGCREATRAVSSLGRV